MMRRAFCDTDIPSFCWDRKLTYADLERMLIESRGEERDRLVAWIMREATFREVWRFLTPQQVAACLPRVEPFLGRWKGFWLYIIGVWRELGKI